VQAAIWVDGRIQRLGAQGEGEDDGKDGIEDDAGAGTQGLGQLRGSSGVAVGLSRGCLDAWAVCGSSSPQCWRGLAALENLAITEVGSGSGRIGL
jgi:hypothetical protein